MEYLRQPWGEEGEGGGGRPNEKLQVNPYTELGNDYMDFSKLQGVLGMNSQRRLKTFP